MASVCCRFVVSGRVQGVFFRDSTRNTANALGLSGHAINKADGTVEVLACGSAEAVDKLQDWLHEGPPSASVSNVRTCLMTGEECPATNGFRIG